ncbi:hypothetical protein GQ43DRAFT_9891 [Delitschia confertaspora ATCC 74209]|uniref:Uncharacterized protein n=1 Tax=Delitschia confertaspora ATCC 74209 TaxID=1513339 RepID=A0A9P4JN27_9PLEO|nr:hypothetical protein GQ43DRAFT_9891 [Delitschia confertaspora ATCC 74209]
MISVIITSATYSPLQFPDDRDLLLAMFPNFQLQRLGTEKCQDVELVDIFRTPFCSRIFDLMVKNRYERSSVLHGTIQVSNPPLHRPVTSRTLYIASSCHPLATSLSGEATIYFVLRTKGKPSTCLALSISIACSKTVRIELHPYKPQTNRHHNPSASGAGPTSSHNASEFLHKQWDKSTEIAYRPSTPFELLSSSAMRRLRVRCRSLTSSYFSYISLRLRRVQNVPNRHSVHECVVVSTPFGARCP